MDDPQAFIVATQPLLMVILFVGAWTSAMITGLAFAIAR